MAQNFFKRKEKKYLLSTDEFQSIIKSITDNMRPDKYHISSVYNVYFDTESDDLVQTSLEQPDYKYKVRVRSYGTESAGKLFFEIKSKVNGVVYKRRVEMSNQEFERYLVDGLFEDSQVMRELDYLMKTKSLRPKLFIAYDRMAFIADSGSDLRITFDKNLRSRRESLNIDKHDDCENYFDDNSCIMEIKTRGGMPEWLVEALSRNSIYPQSFSKYGQIYVQSKKELAYA